MQNAVSMFHPLLSNWGVGSEAWDTEALNVGVMADTLRPSRPLFREDMIALPNK